MNVLYMYTLVYNTFIYIYTFMVFKLPKEHKFIIETWNIFKYIIC